MSDSSLTQATQVGPGEAAPNSSTGKLGPLTQVDGREPLSKWLADRDRQPTVTDLKYLESRLVEVERGRDEAVHNRDYGALVLKATLSNHGYEDLGELLARAEGYREALERISMHGWNGVHEPNASAMNRLAAAALRPSSGESPRQDYSAFRPWVLSSHHDTGADE